MVLPMHTNAQTVCRPASTWRAECTALLERGLHRHPLLTTTAALLLTGCAMVGAVAAFALTVMLPVSWLAGLI